MNTRPMHSRRPLKKAVLIVTAFTGVIVGCDYKGRAAVEEFCRRDGGVTISETVNVKGYLSRDSGSVCLACMEEVGSRQFEYLDVYFKGPNASQLFGEPGYHRVSRGQLGDPRCDPYLKAVEWNKLGGPKYYGLAPNECFAIERLPERPAGYVYSVRYRQIKADNGATLSVAEYLISHEPTGRLLAVNRNYLSKGSASSDMSGGGGVIHKSCWNVDGVVTMLSDEFTRRVLHDMTRPRE